jgi:hypothetical protein
MPMAQGLAFSISLETIKSALVRMYQRRSAPPVGILLGVGWMRMPIEPALRQRLHLTQHFGMEMLEIRSSGPAAHAELKRLEIVIAASGEPVREPADVQRMVRRYQAGETVTLSFLRGGNLRQVTVVLYVGVILDSCETEPLFSAKARQERHLFCIIFKVCPTKFACHFFPSLDFQTPLLVKERSIRKCSRSSQLQPEPPARSRSCLSSPQLQFPRLPAIVEQQ